MAAGGNFLAEFPLGSAQRQRTRAIEEAVRVGSREALWGVRLNGGNYTLADAQEAASGDTEHIKRHGCWHVFFSVHALAGCGQTHKRTAAGHVYRQARRLPASPAQHVPHTHAPDGYVTLCYVTLLYLMLRYSMLCYDALCYVTLCYVMLLYVMLL